MDWLCRLCFWCFCTEIYWNWEPWPTRPPIGPGAWFWDKATDIHDSSTWPEQCSFPIALVNKTERLQKPPCEWWFALEPIPHPKATQIQLDLQPKLFVNTALDQEYLCLPFTAVDEHGKMNSGLDPAWDPKWWEVCQHPRSNTMRKQMYARTYAADTKMDPTNDWAVIVYSWLLIDTYRTADDKLRWSWVDMSVFLQHHDDPSSVTAICYNGYDCRKHVPSYKTPSGSWAPSAHLVFDDTAKQLILTPYDKSLPEGWAHAYELVDVDSMSYDQRAAINSELWSMTCRINDQYFLDSLGVTRDLFIVPGQFGPDVPYPS